MTRTRNEAQLGPYDIELILDVLYEAAQQEITVAQAVQQRLQEIETEVRELREDIRCGPRDDIAEELQAMCDRREDDSRDIRRLMRRFASWRASDERVLSPSSEAAKPAAERAEQSAQFRDSRQS